jgi:FtsH-binding integral membrane protein
MLSKATGLARALALILAVVAGFVSIPNLDVALVLVALGLIGGLAYSEDAASRLMLTVLVMPAVSTALNLIPQFGAQLGQIATNVALAAAGAVATLVAVRIYGQLKGDITGLGGN